MNEDRHTASSDHSLTVLPDRTKAYQGIQSPGSRQRTAIPAQLGTDAFLRCTYLCTHDQGSVGSLNHGVTLHGQKLQSRDCLANEVLVFFFFFLNQNLSEGL